MKRAICKACISLALGAILGLPLVTEAQQTQQTPHVFLVNALQKVSAANVAEFEKLMLENWKPAHQLRKLQGRILNWALYRVRFVGEGDEYNYVSVTYYETILKTEPNDKWLELLKAANPKGDANAIYNRTNAVRDIVYRPMFERLDATNGGQGAQPGGYFVVNFMEPKSGMQADFLKSEIDDWKPVHQNMVETGKMARWAIYRLVMPSGTSFKYHFVTADVFANYEQLVSSGLDESIKKVYPSRTPQEMYEKSQKLRDIVRTELWELVAITN